MKKFLASAICAVVLSLTASAVFADSFVQSWNCKLKEGKKPEDALAANSVWLKWLHEHVSDKITSEGGTAVVGKIDMFLFVDTYPDLGTWAAAQTALQNDAPDSIDAGFDAVLDCTENRLWRLQPTP
jgi:hypothetical protein